jgi:hypothetical protein
MNTRTVRLSPRIRADSFSVEQILLVDNASLFDLVCTEYGYRYGNFGQALFSPRCNN